MPRLSAAPAEQLTFAGLEQLSRRERRTTSAVRVWRNRSTPTAASAVDAAGEGALWTEQFPRWTPTQRRCARTTWPTYRVLCMIGQHRIIVRQDPITRAISVDSPYSLDVLRPTKDDPHEILLRHDQRALRALIDAGLASLCDITRVRIGRYSVTVRRIELTRRGRTQWHRWTALVDGDLVRENRYRAAVDSWLARNPAGRWSNRPTH